MRTPVFFYPTPKWSSGSDFTLYLQLKNNWDFWAQLSFCLATKVGEPKFGSGISFQEYDMKVLVLAGFLSGSKYPWFRVFGFQKCSFCFLDVQKTLSNLDETCVKEELVFVLGGGSNVCFNV